jgi:hypothetical protein
MKICLSAELFWGFSREIEVSQFTNNEEIIEYMVSELKIFLLLENLQLLVEKLEKTQLHMHDQFNNLNNDGLYYICDHDHKDEK